MKTCILGLMFLGLANLTFSQNKIAYNTANSDQFLKIKKTSTETMVTNKASKRMTSFHNLVADYDITTNPIYTPNNRATYTVVFREANNVITNTYNHDGDVMSSHQKFKEIRLPANINADIAKEYPGWAIGAVECTITFQKDELAKVMYKVKIKSENITKTIKVTELNNMHF